MTDLWTQERRTWLRCYQTALQWAEQIRETRERLATPQICALRRISGTTVPFRRQS